MISTLVLALLLVQAMPADPQRQFDFWIGEWTVQNRHIQPDGSWNDGEVTRATEEVTQERLFDVEWNAGALSQHAAARKLDWLLGEWRGNQTDLVNDTEREARLTARLLNKDCLFLDLLETRDPGAGDAEDWDQRMSVRGYVAQRGAWESWTVRESDTVLRRTTGSPEDERAIFEEELPDGSARRETIVRIAESEAVIEEELRAPGESDFTLVRVTELWHAR
jgi:hypothetical protein